MLKLPGCLTDLLSESRSGLSGTPIVAHVRLSVFCGKALPDRNGERVETKGEDDQRNDRDDFTLCSQGFH